MQDLSALRRSRLAEMEGLRSADKRCPSSSGRRPVVKARFLQALFTGDGSVSALPRIERPDLLLDPQPPARPRRPAAPARVRVVSRLVVHATGEYKVVITNRRDARLFASHVGFHGAKHLKLSVVLSGSRRDVHLAVQ